MKMTFSKIFKIKLNHLIIFSVDNYSLINSDRKLSSRLHHFTEKRLSMFKFSSNEISYIIQQVDQNKAHSHDQHSDVENL